MESNRRSRISDLYHAALGRTPEERRAFLNEACEGDENLRQEVESLLSYESASSRFLETPAVAVVVGAAGGARMIDRQIGSYTIAALLGAGGMGEVYRARDGKLGRDVAIKILPAHLTADPERRSRFAREARLLAALNHPHIGAIYGLEESDGVTALVLELVEGPTLADRLARGPLAIPEALAIARQVAEALDEAHEKGIVHRDLKPGNIVLQGADVGHGDVRAKVLDFGLAKTLAAGPGHNLTPHPSGSFDGTAEGRILGTPAYMSPEQARGQAIDKRTDVWAFGCVLYEMLGGRPPFEGDTMSDTFVCILEREPDWSALPATTPASIRRLLEHCLRKDPRKRLHDVADALIEIDDAGNAAASGGVVSVDPRAGFRRKREGLAWIVAALAVALVAFLLIDRRSHPGTPGDTVEFSIDHGWRTFAISPDGHHVAFTSAADSQEPMLWIRSLDKLEFRVLPDTEGAVFPFWRPDSQAIGFFAGGLLKTIQLNGGSPVSVCRAAVGGNAAGADTTGAWNEKEVIIFGDAGGPLGGTALQRVDARGGTPVALTSLKGDEYGHGRPSFLPDGQHFLYLARRPDSSDLRVGSLTSADSLPLGRYESHAEYAAGYLFFARDGNLFAQPFDADALRLKGSPSPIAAKIGIYPFSVSAAGRLAYSSRRGPRQTLTWFDRDGKALSTVGQPGAFQNLDLSPDERYLAVSQRTQSPGGQLQIDLWRIDLERSGAAMRLTADPGAEWDPSWSPKGTQIVFNHADTPGGNHSLFVRPSDASGPNTLFFSSGNMFEPDWSHDGRFILYSQNPSTAHPADGTGSDLWTRATTGVGKPTVFLRTQHSEYEGSFSPDDRWIVYGSVATGRPEVYVRPFPVRSGEFMISRDGGESARWRRDGKEIFFLSLTGKMMSVAIDTTNEFTAGAPKELFQTGFKPIPSRAFVVAKDGQRFLMPVPEPPTPITVLLNWPAKVAK